MAEFNVEFHSLPETFDLDFVGDQAFSLDMELPFIEVTPDDTVFVVTLSWDDDFLPEWADEPGAWVPDQTWAEIKSAGDAGKEITVTALDEFYNLIPATVHYYSESDPPNELAYSVVSFVDDKMIDHSYSISGSGIALYGVDAAIFPNFDSPSRTYTPSDQVQTETITATPGYGYNGIEEVNVTVNAAPAGDWEELDLYDREFITENNQRKWQFKLGFLVDQAGWLAEGLRKGSYKKYNAVPANTTITPTTSPQTVGGANYMMEGALTVEAMSPTVDDLSITPSESAQTFRASSYNLDGFDEVNVGAISSSYVGSNVPQRDSDDLSASGATVSVPAGYYASAASKSVALGSAGTPTATKGAVSNHSVTVTPKVTNGGGYIAGGEETGDPVNVSASELVSGSETKTQNGTYNVTNLAELVVNVSGGGGSSMNVQVAAGVNRVNTTSYTAITGQSITVATTGTYDVYWTGYRSSTSGTNGTQLYIDNTAYGTAQTTFSNNGQAVHLTGVSLTKNQVITLRARARTTSYYMYGGNLTIVQTA